MDLIVDFNKEATLRDIFTLMEFLFVFFIAQRLTNLFFCGIFCCDKTKEVLQS